MKTVVRLDKYMADMGEGTRSAVKEKIRRGYVTVNGQIVKNPDMKVDTHKDEIVCEGKNLSYVHYEYYMLNKPAGVISATEDKRNTTVLDLIDLKKRKDLFPVGRLDKDTEGLLLMTNDGELCHRLLSPKKHVSKIYYAEIEGCVDSGDIHAFAGGLQLDEEITALPAKLTILSVQEESNKSEILLEIYEGKFHQVKRMFEAVGKKVVYLKRLTMGPLHLDQRLAPGDYRILKKDELECLKDNNRKCIDDFHGSLHEMLKDVRAVIFDLDGTVVDSMWVWKDIDIEYLKRFGMDLPDDLQDAIAGISVTQTAVYFKERFKISDSIDKIIADWNEMAKDKYSHEVPLKAGALEFIKYLKYNNIPCAIATSNSTDLTRAVLESHGLKGYFDVVLTGEDIHKGKPDPDVYIETARLLNVKPEECLVFEDIPLGIIAAKAAGMSCVAIDDEFSADDLDKKRELADYYIHDYYDIFSGVYEELSR